MKYFTNEWFIKYYLADADRYVKKSKCAEVKDDIVYRSIYNKKLKYFIHNERSMEIYRSPEEELKRIEEYVNEEGISNEERVRRNKYREIFLMKNEHRLNDGKVFEFDEETEEKIFEEEHKQRIQLFGFLPPHILEKIADLRVFAFGYATEEVIELLKPYCERMNKECEEIRLLAYDETDAAEDYLSERLDVNDYGEIYLTDIIEKNGDVYLKFNEDDVLLVKNGEITERQSDKIYPFRTEIPYTGISLVRAAELHRVDGLFELRFNILNSSECGCAEPWYLTVRGTDIKDLNPVDPRFCFQRDNV